MHTDTHIDTQINFVSDTLENRENITDESE